MKTKRSGIAVVVLALCAVVCGASNQNHLKPPKKPLNPKDVPQSGNFFSLQAEMSDHGWPPLPFNPFAGGEVPVPVYSLGRGCFLYDDSLIDYGSQLSFNRAEIDVASVIGESAALTSFTMNAPFPGDEGGGGEPQPDPPPDLRRNFEKFMGHLFWVVNTNDAAANDPDLYSACVGFPEDTNSGPNLQVARYGANAMLIKANHFDYSQETTRDFALLICDTVDKPIWKDIDLSGGSDSQDGWLVQGMVANWKVTDPLFLVVSNLASGCSAFFRAIPYGGPQVELAGYQPYDGVSNSITLQASVRDLSGVTDLEFELDVDGIPARYSLGTGNSIILDTKYNPNGIATIWGRAINHNAQVYDPTNRPQNTKLFFSGSGSLALNFENETYLAFAGDMCSPEVGTNQIMFAVDRAQGIEATIFNPISGQTVASFSGYVPYAATVVIPWNFTEADGVTPYSSDSYAVSFNALSSASLEITNRIDREGVRTAAGCILTYENEDTAVSAGPYLNSQADNYIGGLAVGLYSALYYWDWGSIPQYSPSAIGPNRDNPVGTSFPLVLTPLNETNWVNDVCFSLTNAAFSDFGYYMGHCNGTEMGGAPPGSKYMKSYMPSQLIMDYVSWPALRPNWRMRKVAIWGCFSDSPSDTTAGGTLPSWPRAFGIRKTSQQSRSWMAKNVGLFFTGGLPQFGYSGTLGGTSAEVAASFDNLWVCGPFSWSGGCDPTYSFAWAFNQTRGMYPELDKGLPAWIGFGYLPYAGIYDSELRTNNVSHVKP